MIIAVRRPRYRLLTGSILIAVAIGGCSNTDPGAPGKPPISAVSEQGSLGSQDAGRGGALPSQHVHGVARNPADGRVYLATHDGLFHITEDAEPVRVGPVIDLMGFTITGPNHFYASGHPGSGVDLPDPVGLIESTDGGQAWAPLSRQGQSDFHTLTSSRSGIVGFDGEQLAATGDGRQWRQLAPPVAPYAVAASPDGTMLLVTSPSGLVRSADAGQTWQAVQTPVVLQWVTWADATTVVGVTPDGQIAVSADAAATWKLRAGIGAAPHAISAQRGTDGSMEILAVTAAGILRSTDNATTFTRYGR